MRWINKLSDADIEKLLKKLGVEYESLRIKKETNCIKVYLNRACWHALAIYDFSIVFSDDEEEYLEFYDCTAKEKLFYLFMENNFGKEYLTDLIRNKTGLSGRFLRKKLR